MMDKESQMMDSKVPIQDVQEDGDLNRDVLDMARLGKKQEFKVRKKTASYSILIQVPISNQTTLPSEISTSSPP